jgi:hypothetical protein
MQEQTKQKNNIINFCDILKKKQRESEKIDNFNSIREKALKIYLDFVDDWEMLDASISLINDIEDFEMCLSQKYDQVIDSKKNYFPERSFDEISRSLIETTQRIKNNETSKEAKRNSD